MNDQVWRRWVAGVCGGAVCSYGWSRMSSNMRCGMCSRGERNNAGKGGLGRVEFGASALLVFVLS
jgi:hypothetical protein